MTPASTTRFAISDWVKGLAEIPESQFSLKNVQDFVIAHPVDAASLDPYLHYSRSNYTRNLVFKNALFECMVICWEIGQNSRIHNHRDQNCWMSAPIGRLFVQNFRVEDRNADAHTCQLFPTDTYVMDSAHPAYVNPLEPVHSVHNLPEYNQRAASIHIYSRPFDTCEIYLREKGTYLDAPLHFTSEYGSLMPDAEVD